LNLAAIFDAVGKCLEVSLTAQAVNLQKHSYPAGATNWKSTIVLRPQQPWLI